MDEPGSLFLLGVLQEPFSAGGPWANAKGRTQTESIGVHPWPIYNSADVIRLTQLLGRSHAYDEFTNLLPRPDAPE